MSDTEFMSCSATLDKLWPTSLVTFSACSAVSPLPPLSFWLQTAIAAAPTPAAVPAAAKAVSFAAAGEAVGGAVPSPCAVCAACAAQLAAADSLPVPVPLVASAETATLESAPFTAARDEGGASLAMSALRLGVETKSSSAPRIESRGDSAGELMPMPSTGSVIESGATWRIRSISCAFPSSFSSSAIRSSAAFSCSSTLRFSSSVDVAPGVVTTLLRFPSSISAKVSES
mmetsp:Transcript_30814/g.67485  ORF Transcript_30814/g.67485 Transcript_30814/m.67485 type:complete len:230 (+) Transcript_30814:1409-2098(+)